MFQLPFRRSSLRARMDFDFHGRGGRRFAHRSPENEANEESVAKSRIKMPKASKSLRELYIRKTVIETEVNLAAAQQTTRRLAQTK